MDKLFRLVANISESNMIRITNNTAFLQSEPLLKRSLDIVLSTLMMILSLPVSLPIALAIKLEDG